MQLIGGTTAQQHSLFIFVGDHHTCTYLHGHHPHTCDNTVVHTHTHTFNSCITYCITVLRSGVHHQDLNQYHSVSMLCGTVRWMLDGCIANMETSYVRGSCSLFIFQTVRIRNAPWTSRSRPRVSQHLLLSRSLDNVLAHGHDVVHLHFVTK